jgi:CMP-N-acetylneuraminic acid synthetase
VINDKRILCVITARAGSKGIPGKNYRELLGKPLVRWSVEASLASKYVDITVVSSNCEKVSEVYLEHLLEMGKDARTVDNFWYVRRPDELATDTAKNELAMIHAIRQVHLFHGLEFDAVINLQPTSPCRIGNILDRSIELYYSGDYDSLLTADRKTPFIWQKNDDKWVYTVDKNSCCDRKMRQEFNESEFLFHDNGNIYITDTIVMLGTECRIGKFPVIFETTGMNNLQIDEEHDFQLIEKMAEVKGLRSLI